MRSFLGKLNRFYIAQKYVFDMGQQILSLMSFTMMLVVASDKLKPVLHIRNTYALVGIGVVGGYFAVWLFGLFLDRVMKLDQHRSLEGAKRSKTWDMEWDYRKRLEGKVDQLLKIISPK